MNTKYDNNNIIIVSRAYFLQGDPREHMHRAALQGLRMVGNKLIAKDEEAYRNK
jgi:hypothetical protein